MTSSAMRMNSSVFQQVLPCFPGYAMGGIIPTVEIELTCLKQEAMDIEHSIQTITALIESLKEKQDLISKNQSFKLSFQLGEIQDKKKVLEEKITELKKEQGKGVSPYLGTILPIDYNRTRVQYRDTADASENMHFVILDKGSMPEASGSGKSSFDEQLDIFKQHLTKMRYLPTVLSLIEQIEQTLQMQMKKHQGNICLLGSFVTLSPVKSLDPIILREEAVIDADIKKEENVDKYSVISEAVLGAVFIGFGINLSSAAEEDPEVDPQPLLSKYQILSFVSQGVIPESKTRDLWNTYCNWKEQLNKNPKVGFPIGFKLRSLRYIFEENGVEISPKQEEVN